MNSDEKPVQLKQEQRWKEWVRKKIGYYISTGQWDNVSTAQPNAWLGNFDEEGQKWALALLNNFLAGETEYEVRHGDKYPVLPTRKRPGGLQARIPRIYQEKP
jgi:hypothetical protein